MFFLALNLLLVLLYFYSFFAIASLFFLFLCCAGVFLTSFGSTLGVKSENLHRDDYEFVSSEAVSALVVFLYYSLNVFVVVVADIATARSKSHYKRLVWVALGLLLLTRVLSDLAILWLTLLAVFSGPALYMRKKDKINDVLGRVRSFSIGRVRALSSRIPGLSRKKLD